MDRFRHHLHWVLLSALVGGLGVVAAATPNDGLATKPPQFANTTGPGLPLKAGTGEQQVPDSSRTGNLDFTPDPRLQNSAIIFQDASDQAESPELNLRRSLALPPVSGRGGSGAASPAFDHSSAMWDDHGDGWNDGYIDVFVNDDVVLSGVPLADGSGPETGTCDVLVAPALDEFNYFHNNDFLERLSGLTLSNADFFDGSLAIPTLEDLLPYDMVITFTDTYWPDQFAMGDVLADYVEAGGKVLIGQFSHYTAGAWTWLDGRIMDEYVPAFIDDRLWGSEYTGDGVDCIFDEIPNFELLPYDHMAALVGEAAWDGTFLDGSPVAAYRLDRSVYYVAGHMAGYITFDPADRQTLAELTANICYCEPEPALGSCCDPFNGTCTDNVDVANCMPPMRWTEDRLCAELDPPCGNPGACCNDSTGACSQEFERNCAGRFALGAQCADDPFHPGCGDTGTCDILYAPTHDDEPRFRGQMEFITASNCDYYDARQGTPTLGELMQYEMVITWVDFPYANAFAMGDVLADYVEAGGRVILGLWSASGSGNINYLQGRLMQEYNPVFIDDLYWGGGAYAGDGTGCIHDGVGTYGAGIVEHIASLAPDAWSDGTLAGGTGGDWPAIGFRTDRKVTYAVGFNGGHEMYGDWPELFANMCYCAPADLNGACCDPENGTCTDDVAQENCQPPLQWTYDTLCADLEPLCGNPGACCDDDSGVCTQTVFAQCAGRFIPGALCEDDLFDPPCGEYESCWHTLTLHDDGGNGWQNASLDLYVGGLLRLEGVTLDSGAGPEGIHFRAAEGEDITTVWHPGNFNGGWDFEAWYCIAGLDGTPLGCDGAYGVPVDPTGITVLGSCLEIECGNGACQSAAGESCVTCPADCGTCECVFQGSLHDSAYLSDLDCQACGGAPLQIVADNFVLFADTEIEQVRFMGSYTPDDIPVTVDQFTIIIRQNDAGLPGAAVATLGPVEGTRSPAGVAEYEHVVDLNHNLPAGTYWLEIYNNTKFSDETWAWYGGTLDGSYGLPGLAYSLAMPENWGFNGEFNLAFELVCSAPCVAEPDVNGDGLIDAADLAILLGAWGVCPLQECCTEDLNQDGNIDAVDLAILLGSWSNDP